VVHSSEAGDRQCRPAAAFRCVRRAEATDAGPGSSRGGRAAQPAIRRGRRVEHCGALCVSDERHTWLGRGRAASPGEPGDQPQGGTEDGPRLGGSGRRFSPDVADRALTLAAAIPDARERGETLVCTAGTGRTSFEPHPRRPPRRPHKRVSRPEPRPLSFLQRTTNCSRCASNPANSRWPRSSVQSS